MIEEQERVDESFHVACNDTPIVQGKECLQEDSRTKWSSHELVSFATLGR